MADSATPPKSAVLTALSLFHDHASIKELPHKSRRLLDAPRRTAAATARSQSGRLRAPLAADVVPPRLLTRVHKLPVKAAHPVYSTGRPEALAAEASPVTS